MALHCTTQLTTCSGQQSCILNIAWSWGYTAQVCFIMKGLGFKTKMLHINIKLSKKYVSLADIIMLNSPLIWLESDFGVGADVGMHCWRRGFYRWSQLWEHSISAHFQGFPTRVQLTATTSSSQIWNSGWILPNFYVRTISVAWKPKELQIISWKQFFFPWPHAQ